MSALRFHRTWLVILATLFFALQSTAIAHAAKYNGDPHEHNGIVCTLDALAVNSGAVVPVPTVVDTPIMASAAPVYHAPFIDAPVVTPPGRAPPPRSPPTLSH